MVNFNLVEITLHEIENDPLLSFQAVNWTEQLANHFHNAWIDISKNIVDGIKTAMNEHQIDKITCPIVPYGLMISEMLNDINLITSPSILFIVKHIITEIELEGWSYKMFDNRHTEMITFSLER